MDPELKAYLEGLRKGQERLREEMRAQGQALQEEMQAGEQTLRGEIRAGDEALREAMRVEGEALRGEMRAGDEALREELHEMDRRNRALHEATQQQVKAAEGGRQVVIQAMERLFAQHDRRWEARVQPLQTAVASRAP